MQIYQPPSFEEELKRTIENVFGYLNYFVANEIEMSDDQVCLKMQLIHFSNPVDIGYWND